MILFQRKNEDMNTIAELLSFFSVAALAVVAAPFQNASGHDALKVTSNAFAAGAKIPKKYTCDDSNISPPLRIENIPPGAKSLALIVEDPDAPGGTWNHWLVWNIDPHTSEIRENSVPKNGTQGTTDFGSAKYGGPCPPSGSHRYYFKVYALDTNLSLSSSAKRGAVEKAIAGHVLAEGSVMGTYSRGH
jgi:Raf kinase inhibitor-like YbhB/YbcL family protein